MSYLVLARKWRPQVFEDLIGQEHVSRTLSNSITSGRVHHAFLFTGARGVGKTSAARILAKALNCEQGPTPSPCNVCSSCTEITSGQGVDVFEIDGASSTGVDDVRELRENIRYLPSRSRYKIFIIDEVHMLSLNAFNALLKTLEEPPPHAKFVFATTEPHKIPITILSRCQRFDFRKIPLPRMLSRLREIVDAEKIGVSDRSLALVARRGEGSMRDALSTLDQVIAFCGEDVADEDVQGLLGMVDRRLLLEATEGMLQRDCRRILDVIRRVDGLGYSFRRFTQELIENYRSLVLVKVLEDSGEFLEATPEEVKELKTLSEMASLEDLQRTVTLLSRTESELAGSAQPRLILEMSLLRLAHMAPSRDISTLIQKLEALERQLGQVDGQAGADYPPPPEAEGASQVFEPPAEERVSPKKVEAPSSHRPGREGWQGLVEHVRSQRPLIASLLDHGRPLELEPPRIELAFSSRSFHLEQMKDTETLEAFRKIANQYFGQEITVVVKAVDNDDSKAPPSLLEERKAQETDRRKRLQEDALNHPIVRKALDIFQGEVQEVRPIDRGFV